jgi:N6-adenosine-specific RNA methylase IME4
VTRYACIAIDPPWAEHGGGKIKRGADRHSEKPSRSFEIIEAVSPGPRLEMFARAPRAGWDVWGNEV